MKDKNHGASVLITGGSGLIGRNLTSLLLSGGYKVSHLSRKENKFGKVRVYRWNPEKRIIDPEIFNGVDYLVHLAGTNIGEKRWTEKRKAEIKASRIDTSRLLFSTVKDYRINLRAFISASGTGYYGSLTDERIFTENDPPSNDFLGSLCRDWEAAADLFSDAGIRTVKIRTSVVLARESMALKRLLAPVKSGFLLKTGSGKQYMPWIHISDLCNIYQMAIEDDSMRGAFNAASPSHTSHGSFMKVLAEIMKRPVLRPGIPPWVLKLFLGEMAGVVTEGSRVSAEKIIDSGFVFGFGHLKDALYDILQDY